jgi:hypothetical protein
MQGQPATQLVGFVPSGCAGGVTQNARLRFISAVLKGLRAGLNRSRGAAVPGYRLLRPFRNVGILPLALTPFGRSDFGQDDRFGTDSVKTTCRGNFVVLSQGNSCFLRSLMLT